ncbi:MAG: preprotein translocase subunit YajC [Pseudomonadota bacterium]
MSFFITDAFAQNAPAATPESGLMSFLPLIVIFAIFYFLLIRPQMKRAKEHKNMVAALTSGDEIVTSGGLLGRITEAGDDFVTVEIADGVKVKVQRHAVASVMPKGTIKST